MNRIRQHLCHLRTVWAPRLSAARKVCLLLGFTLALNLTLIHPPSLARDLQDVLKAGKLRHLGIPYANFISSIESGLDVELMRKFSAYLGVEYEFVNSSWRDIVADLTGKTFQTHGEDVILTGKCPVQGDVIASGFTILPWRKKLIDFASAYFPTGVWLITYAGSDLSPVTPTGSIQNDINAVKKKLNGRSVLVLEDSCLDPSLYKLEETGASIQLLDPSRDICEMIPLVIARIVETTLMDVPVALIALEKWPGDIKIVGPVSKRQEMAPGFSKSSPELKAAFETFFKRYKSDGSYRRLVMKYYPSVFTYYPDFLK
ncbi:putative ABC transporter, periplasmic binding protein [Desulfosarcina variabilis str. Montpellier]|jgi:ABC-type amino acid transport substrate-binding protein|uniref:transporter substrate-binding domain-containing protein n=1 Tax=Desulfosarcina variabilis TaxID=2300 RepID=UPI003AFB66EE